MGATHSYEKYKFNNILDHYDLVENFTTPREFADRLGFTLTNNGTSGTLSGGWEVQQGGSGRSYCEPGSDGGFDRTMMGQGGIPCGSNNRMGCDTVDADRDRMFCVPGAMKYACGGPSPVANTPLSPDVCQNSGELIGCTCDCTNATNEYNSATDLCDGDAKSEPCTTGPDGVSACSGEGTASGTHTPPDFSTCQCTCTPGSGFVGPNCEYSDAVTCSGHGTVNAQGACICDQGYSGDDCSQGEDCSANNIGPNNAQGVALPCQHSGTGSGNLPNCNACDCSATNYEGQWCETPIPCQATDSLAAVGYIECNNGADASNVASGNVVDGCTCNCADDYRGANCDFHVDDHCSQHGAVDNQGVCTCDPGWTGDICDTGVCQGDSQVADNYIDCNNHGTVIPNTYPNCSCNCNAGWQGDDCSSAVQNSCTNVDLNDGLGTGPIGWDDSAGGGAGGAVHCEHGTNLLGHWTHADQGPDYSNCGACQCPEAHDEPLYTGAGCATPAPCTEADIEHLHQGGCGVHGGTVDTTKTRVEGCICDCSAAAGWEGDFCESTCQSGDPAAAGYVACQNGGTPTGTPGNCTCSCPRTHTGDRCQTVATRVCTDDQTSPQSPDVSCNSHGSATGRAQLGLAPDGSQDITTSCACQCVDGYEGTNCNTQSTCGGMAADGQSCQNNGTAGRDANQDCVCTCQSGFVGDHCEMTRCEFDAAAAGGLESAICRNGRCAPAGSFVDLADPTEYCLCSPGWGKDGQGACTQGYDACMHTRAQNSDYCEGGTASPHTSPGGLTDCRCSCPPVDDGQGNTIHSHLVSGSGATEARGSLADPTAVDARCVANCPSDCGAGDTRAGCCNSPNGICNGSIYPPSCVCDAASGMQGPNCADGRNYCQENENGNCGPLWRNVCQNNTCACQGRWTKAAGANAMDSCDILTRACGLGAAINCGSNGSCVDGYSTLAVALTSTATTIQVEDISSFRLGRPQDGESTQNGQLIIQNELINYTGIDSGNKAFIGCTRGVSFGSFGSATTHPMGSDVAEHHSRCKCNPGYSGTNCETSPSICAPLNCSQIGVQSTCVVDPGNGIARCQCINGYSGIRCDTPPDPCDYPINYQCGICSDGSSTSQTACAAADPQGVWTSTGTRTVRADGSCYCMCEPGYHGDMCEFTTSTCNAGQCTADGTERAIGNNEMCAFNGECKCKVGYQRGPACTGADDGTGTPCALNGDQTACAVPGGDCVYYNSQECVALTACDVPGSIIEPFEQLGSVGDNVACDNNRGTTSSQGNSCICVCNAGMTKDADGKCTRAADVCSTVDPATGVRTNKCTQQFQTCDATTGQCGCPTNYAFDSGRNSCVPSTDACSELGGLTNVSCGAGNLYVYGEDADGTAETGTPGRAVPVSGDHGSYGCACACDAGYKSEGESGNCLIPPTATTTQPDGTLCSAVCGTCSDGISTSPADCADAGGIWTSTGTAYYLPAGTCSDSRSTTQAICTDAENGGTCTNRNATNRTDCNSAGGTWTTATWNAYADGDRCVCHCASGNYSGATCENVCDHLVCENGTKTLNGGVCECVCNAGFEGDRCDVPIPACRSANAPSCNDHGVQREMDDGTCVCQCNEGWTGEHCDTQSCPECGQAEVCYDVDGTVMKDDAGNDIVCESTPCTAADLREGKRKCDLKGGTFTKRGQCVTNAADVPVCECTTGTPSHSTGWTGSNCEIPPDGCSAVDCGDNGHCINGQCACDNGYNGARCQISPRPCDRLDCGESQGRGHCVTNINAQTGMMEGSCVCEQDYTGLLCQNPPSVCEPNPCQNGACARKEGSDPPQAICRCPDGYTGTFCEDPPNPCTDNANCGEQGLCVPVANPDLSAGGLVSSCVCLSGYTGPNCTVPPNRCTYPSSRDCSGLGVCIDDATGEPTAQQPANQDGCVAPQGQSYSWEYTNCRDASGNAVRTTTGNPKEECESAGHDYLGECVNGQCVCNNAGGFKLTPGGLCTGIAGACVRFLSEDTRCTGNTQRNANDRVILESDASGCRCVCVGPSAENIMSKKGFAAPLCDEVDIHTWNANAVDGANEATQCGAYGTVVEVQSETGSTKYCAPADMREQPNASGVRPVAYGNQPFAGRLDATGKFSIPPRNQGGKVDDNGVDACAPGGVSNSDGTCECMSGYSGDTCQTAPDLCATAGLTNCQNGGTCIVPSGTTDPRLLTCDCPDGYRGRNCENPGSLCDSKDCGGYCSDVSCTGDNDGSGTACALNESKTGCAVNAGNCVYQSSPDTGAANRQACSGDKLWTETGFCYPDPTDPSRGSCLCTHGYTKPTHPLDGTVVQDKCTVEPNLCDGKRIHGDCEKNGNWLESSQTKEMCDTNDGTWHPRGTCNPADGSIQCNQITYNLPDGTVKRKNAFRNQDCSELTSNCLRSELWDRSKPGAGELCNGNGTCIDGGSPTPSCTGQDMAADGSREGKPWLLTETACVAGGGEWNPRTPWANATCDCYSGYSGITCTDEGSVCDGAGAGGGCGVSTTGTPTGYCTEYTYENGEKVANCTCVGGYTKPDGTQGKPGTCSAAGITTKAACDAAGKIWTQEPPSSAKCSISPTPVPCTAGGGQCMGAHVFCNGVGPVPGECVCSDGWVYGDNPTGICNARSNLDPDAGTPDFCYDPSQPQKGNIRQCNDHGSCYEGECHCNDGWTGNNCQVVPDGCSSVSCGEHGTCAADAEGNPVCSCPADGSYTMNPLTGQCDIPKSACPYATCDPSALTTVTNNGGVSSQELSVSACRQSGGRYIACDCAPGYVDKDNANCEAVPGKDGASATTFKYNCSGASTDGVQKCDYRLNACEVDQQRCNGHGTPHLIQGSDGSEMCACICEAPYTGDQCEIIDPCLVENAGVVSHVNCGSCGVCVATGSNAGDYTCQCMDDDCTNTGGDPKGVCMHTDQRANACTPGICGHGACQYDPTRPDDHTAYTCVCDGDWGKDASGHCNVAPCDNTSCGTHGACFEVGNRAVCQCQDGFLYDTETGTCDIQCPWGTHGAGCQNTYDMCNLGSLPTHVKSQLADPIGFQPGQPGIPGGSYERRSASNPGGKPDWATGISSMKNFQSQAGQGGVCSTERDSYGNAYPLISCRGLGSNRWMKGASQSTPDATCVTEFANIRDSNPDAASDRDGWVSDDLWSAGIVKSKPRGNHSCEIMQCNKTPCGALGAANDTTNNTAGRKYGQLTDLGGVTCHDCPANKTINFKDRYRRDGGADPSVETGHAFGCSQMRAGPADRPNGAWEIGCGCGCNSGNISNATSQWEADKHCGLFSLISTAESGISKQTDCSSVCPGGDVMASAKTQSAATENVG